MAVHAESSIQLNTIPAYTSLLGGHFVYRSSGTQSTPASVNVINGLSNFNTSNPSTWGYNTHIGANGIKLRFNEIDLSTWSASNGLQLYYPTLTNETITGSQLGAQLTNESLIFYNPQWGNTNNKGIELGQNGLLLYKPLQSGEPSQSTAATLNSNGLNITEGSIILGSEDSTTHRHPFEVNSNGSLYAIDATIVGGITATSLTVAPNAVITDSTGRLDNDAIEVGGRNLMSEIDVFRRDEEDTSLPAGTALPLIYRFSLTQPLESNVTYTLQLWNVQVMGSNKSNITMNVYYCDDILDNELIVWGSDNFNSDGYAERLSCTFNKDNLQTIEYKITEDITVNLDKTYYTYNSSTTEYDKIENPDPTVNPHSLNWYEYYGYTIEIYCDRQNDRNLTVENFKLEKGNKPTEWSVAPEDTENLLNEFSSSTNEQLTALNPLLSRVQLEDDKITLITEVITDNTPPVTLKSKLMVTSTGIELYKNNGADDIMISSFAEDIILGESSAPHLQLTPTNGLSFLSGDGNPVAYISSDTLEIEQANIRNLLQIGNFTWKKQGDNRISLVYTAQSTPT